MTCMRILFRQQRANIIFNIVDESLFVLSNVTYGSFCVVKHAANPCKYWCFKRFKTFSNQLWVFLGIKESSWHVDNQQVRIKLILLQNYTTFHFTTQFDLYASNVCLLQAQAMNANNMTTKVFFIILHRKQPSDQINTCHYNHKNTYYFASNICKILWSILFVFALFVNQGW